MSDDSINYKELLEDFRVVKEQLRRYEIERAEVRQKTFDTLGAELKELRAIVIFDPHNPTAKSLLEIARTNLEWIENEKKERASRVEERRKFWTESKIAMFTSLLTFIVTMLLWLIQMKGGK